MASERRLHPLSFIFAIGDAARQFLLPSVAALFATRPGETWQVWAAVVIVPVAIAALARALSVRYWFEGTELVIKSGFLFRRVRHIPYDRVQNVGVVQNVLHRAISVIEVRIETGGGMETEAVLRVVGTDALAEIRSRVFAQRVEDAPVAEQQARGPRVLLHMQAREIALFGLVQGSGMLVAGAIFGLLWEVGVLDRTGGWVLGEQGGGRGVVRQVVRAVSGGGLWPVRSMLMTAAVLGGLLFVFRLLSTLWTVVKYYGFTLTRMGEDLRCEYGLLTRVGKTIPIRRIQKITVREGPWHRLFRRAALQVHTAGGTAVEGADRTTAWLAPLVRRTSLMTLAGEILPEAAADVRWEPVHPRGVRRELFAVLILLLPFVIALAWLIRWWVLLPLPVFVGWAILYARRSVAAMRWGVSSDAVHYASGWFWRSHLIAPLAKVQAVSRHESPFDRRHGMASVFADTAGGAVFGHTIGIPYLAASVATTLAQRLATEAARAEFRW